MNLEEHLELLRANTHPDLADAERFMLIRAAKLVKVGNAEEAAKLWWPTMGACNYRLPIHNDQANKITLAMHLVPGFIHLVLKHENIAYLTAKESV